MSIEKINQYREQVDAWLGELLDQGVVQFDRLAANLPGVFPTEIVAALNRIGRELDFQSADQQGLNSSFNTCEVTKDTANLLPVAHPLDFDWRFSKQASKQLVESVRNQETIVLLGAPSLVAPLADVCNSGIFLFDANQQLQQRLTRRYESVRVTVTDLLESHVERSSFARAVVCDPPWYYEHIKCFLWSTAFVSEVGSFVYCSLPPIGTRPGVDSEREKIFAWANEVGLEFVRLKKGSLEYVSPLFERNALLASQTPEIEGHWRHGDLAIFEVSDSIQTPFPKINSNRNVWFEESIGEVRFKLRHKSTITDDPTLKELVEGDVLNSVSRRDERRSQADVWTSGNRVYKCDNTELLALVIQAVERDVELVEYLQNNASQQLSSSQISVASRAFDKISQISRVETDEIRRVHVYNFQ